MAPISGGKIEGKSGLAGDSPALITINTGSATQPHPHHRLGPRRPHGSPPPAFITDQTGELTLSKK